MRRRSCPHGAVRTLKVVNGTSGLRTRALCSLVKRHTVSTLGLSVHVEEIPHLGDLRATVVQ